MTLMLDLCAERVPEGGWSRVAIDNASDDNTLTDWHSFVTWCDDETRLSYL